jgi:hypothetical protein
MDGPVGWCDIRRHGHSALVMQRRAQPTIVRSGRRLRARRVTRPGMWTAARHSEARTPTRTNACGPTRALADEPRTHAHSDGWLYFSSQRDLVGSHHGSHRLTRYRQRNPPTARRGWGLLLSLSDGSDRSGQNMGQKACRPSLPETSRQTCTSDMHTFSTATPLHCLHSTPLGLDRACARSLTVRAPQGSGDRVCFVDDL